MQGFGQMKLGPVLRQPQNAAVRIEVQRQGGDATWSVVQCDSGEMNRFGLQCLGNARGAQNIGRAGQDSDCAAERRGIGASVDDPRDHPATRQFDRCGQAGWSRPND